MPRDIASKAERMRTPVVPASTPAAAAVGTPTKSFSEKVAKWVADYKKLVAPRIVATEIKWSRGPDGITSGEAVHKK